MSVTTQLQHSSKTPTDSQSHSFSFSSKQRPLDVRQLANPQVRYTEKSPEITRLAVRRLLLGVISFDVMIALALFLNAFWVAASICSVVVFRLQFL
jgi:hypothetical protein